MNDAASWIALGAVVLATALVAWAGWRTWQAWRRVQLTREAAVALVDVHRDRLDEAVLQASDAVGTLGASGEQLAESLAQLREDAAHLRWMFDRIPAERDRLRRELVELVLPNGRDDDA